MADTNVIAPKIDRSFFDSARLIKTEIDGEGETCTFTYEGDANNDGVKDTVVIRQNENGAGSLQDIIYGKKS